MSLPSTPAPRMGKSRAWSPSRGISFSTKPQPPPKTATSEQISANSSSHDAISPTPATNQDDFDAAAATNLPGEDGAEVEEPQDNSDMTPDREKPPMSPWEFKMLDSLFHAAKKAPADSPGSFWSYDMYRRTDENGVARKPVVHYCRSKHTMERVLRNYFMDDKVLGFDLEWIVGATKASGVRRMVSLIQVASPSRIALFHVAIFSKHDLEEVSPAFREIMENPEITKVGVNIRGDASRVRDYLGIKPRGLFELSHVYRLVTYSKSGQYRNINKKLVSLAAQVQDYLHLPLFKGDVRSSDWSKPLNPEQVTYSASDAYASLQLYATLQYHREQLDPCPPNPYHLELDLPIRLAEGIEIDADDEGVTIDTNTTKAATDKTKQYRDSVLQSLEAQDLQSTESVGKRSTKPPGPKDSRVEAAEDRAKVYMSSNPDSPAKMSVLRAYFLWHKHYLEPPFIAKLLRDPPLQVSTVNSYIMTAIQAANLPFNVERLSEEVTGSMTSSSMWRYPTVKSAISDAAKAQESKDEIEEWEFEPMPSDRATH